MIPKEIKAAKGRRKGDVMSTNNNGGQKRVVFVSWGSVEADAAYGAAVDHFRGVNTYFARVVALSDQESYEINEGTPSLGEVVCVRDDGAVESAVNYRNFRERVFVMNGANAAQRAAMLQLAIEGAIEGGGKVVTEHVGALDTVKVSNADPLATAIRSTLSDEVRHDAANRRVLLGGDDAAEGMRQVLGRVGALVGYDWEEEFSRRLAD